MVFRELSRLGPSIRPHGELLLLLMQKKPTFVPDSEAFNSYIGDGFLVPELKDASEASKDEQADTSSENNVARRFALHGGQSDGIDLTNFCHTNRQEITLATSSKQYTTASSSVMQDKLSWFHLDAVTATHKFRG